MKKSGMTLAAAVLAAFVLGVALSDAIRSVAAASPGGAVVPPAEGTLELGMSSAEALKALGRHPVKINFDGAGFQTWFFRDAQGIVSPQFDFDHGVVVRLYEAREK